MVFKATIYVEGGGVLKASWIADYREAEFKRLEELVNNSTSDHERKAVNSSGAQKKTSCLQLGR